MSFTINIDSFSEENIRERTALTQAVDAGANSIKVESTAGYADDDIIYVGRLGTEGCEKAVVAAVVDGTTLNLSAALTLPHAAYSDVTSVLGDKLHIYRAVNVDDGVPPDESFTILATREIDADQPSTYYRDSAGSSGYWYRTSYFNDATLEETSLSEAFRGDDFEHYASLSVIRSEAGFANAVNLKDSIIAEDRRQAESEINSALAGIYTVPFQPVPEAIRTLTIQLAAAMLKVQMYPGSRAYADELKAARSALQAYADQSATIIGDDGQAINDTAPTYWPNDTAPRSFRIGDEF